MTNELKCPVCDKEMKYMGDIGSFLYGCTCGVQLCLEDIDNVNTLIQSRIDKEKAAAVQQERERVKISAAKNIAEIIRISLRENWPQNQSWGCHNCPIDGFIDEHKCNADERACYEGILILMDKGVVK